MPYLKDLGPPEDNATAPPNVETAKLDGSGGKNKLNLYEYRDRAINRSIPVLFLNRIVNDRYE